MDELVRWQAEGTRAAFARVIGLEGFSSWSGDELVGVNAAGELSGDILGRLGAERIASAGTELLDGPRTLVPVTIEVQGKQVAEAGLSCGGSAHLLLQAADAVPPVLWEALRRRSSVALVTRLDGPEAGAGTVVVHPDGSLESAGATATAPEAAVATALELLASGHTGSRRVEDPAGMLLVEAWVPAPRLIIVGAGELVAALESQGALLGWEARSTEDASALGELFAWGGAASALVVLAHDAHVDVPALAAGLAAGVDYVGAMGSRRTQSRRLERLRADGVAEALLDRIHRPIGLDLGGRGPAEIALAICAEILASRSGRDGRPLAQRDTPIHDRPGAITTS